ncbi:semaphorin-2A isoform X2 [Bactrocera dorsalis]|uniref:Semaphorin-2A isoform X2 n=1 Tax=Bactrocera dorsalis TaxID=27457 RepID=A0A8N4QG51_BACDO|nr:semaphorin-2A isoform X2 [Bactrocera dorsalis]XP_049306721.1 semaphorin-2A isoform X2 [Bactrocera dorsalis]XP_049306722.1 semaphorin-2A isoform X2 [Bactrocera dorsalis]
MAAGANVAAAAAAAANAQVEQQHRLQAQPQRHQRHQPQWLLVAAIILTLFTVSIQGITEELSPDHVREFNCGKLYYRTFHMNEAKDTLYVGAMDRVFRLNLKNISSSQCDRDVINLEPTRDDVVSCVSKGKSQIFDCKNHIRVIQSMENGDRLYVCGTNAHNPKDYVIYSNLTHLPRSEYVIGVGQGIAKCPYDPLDNSTAIYVEEGNPGDLPGLYSGTNAEFTKADTVIFRTDLYNTTAKRLEYKFKRTLKYDSKWLDKPNFVGSFDIGEYVYFFFRETAVEYINCGKAVYSRIARVCKKDIGGKNLLAHNWATYLKARLNCSISGEFPFYFNEIQSVYQLPTDKTRFYATFTTSTNGLIGSAVCSFHINEVQAAFNGKFKEQSSSNSAWLPVLNSRVPEPRPGTCVNDTSNLPDTVLYFIRSHPLMDKAVNHEHNNPVYYKRDLVFTKLVVDKIRIDILNQEYTVYYVGTNLGRIYKIVQYYRNGESLSKLLDIFDVAPKEAIQVMGLSQARKSLYVATDHRIKQIDLAMCNRRYDNCFRCVRDPYCGWDKETNTCRPYELDLLQDVANETSDICDSSVLKKKIVVTYGQSVHLGCFVKIPEVLKNEQVTWYHHSKDKGRYEIKYSPTKYIETTERGLVVVSVNEADGGRYDCHLGGSLLCSYNITVDAHRCTPPNKSNDYQKIYSDWCHEFEKYKTAMKSWEKKQAQCSSRQNFSNQHPNEVFRKNNV